MDIIYSRDISIPPDSIRETVSLYSCLGVCTCMTDIMLVLALLCHLECAPQLLHSRRAVIEYA
eukprot:867243-Pyramimonas_sp.AAC.1